MNRALMVTGWLMLLALTRVSATDQWPRFRGPQSPVSSDDPTLPDAWSEASNVVWKASIPGLGWSSPIVWDDHIFLTSAISSSEEPAPAKGLYDPGDEHGKTKATAAQRWMVYDVDFKTGAIRWERELRRVLPLVTRHVKNSYASESAITDGERVYVYFGSLGLLTALDLNGETVWSKELGVFNTQVELGTGASPVLYKDRIYVVNDNTTQSFLAAFDKRTGKEIWRVNREER